MNALASYKTFGADHDFQTFEINLAIDAIDRTGLLKDMTSILSDLKVNVLSVQSPKIRKRPIYKS